MWNQLQRMRMAKSHRSVNYSVNHSIDQQSINLSAYHLYAKTGFSSGKSLLFIPTKVFRYWARFIQQKISGKLVLKQMERQFSKSSFPKFWIPLEFDVFTGNFEIPGIFCSIGDFISIKHSRNLALAIPTVMGVVYKLFVCFSLILYLRWLRILSTSCLRS